MQGYWTLIKVHVLREVSYCMSSPSSMFLQILLLLWFLLRSTTCDEIGRPMQNVAAKFGTHMLNIGHEKSCFNTINTEFQQHHSQVKEIKPEELMESMRNDLTNMLSWKRNAVKNIAEHSEKISSSYHYEKEIRFSGFYNVKYLYDSRFNTPEIIDLESYKSLDLSPHPNFEDSVVNLENSAVHVPINVYEKASDILNDIKWSENLTSVFKSNLATDPSLSFQFFGSAKGFLRIYPATKWKVAHDVLGHSKISTPDLYDCRMRQWYIQAAASPKDVIVLLDTSGSMKGLRRQIAYNVVNSILETLNENDFVLVLKYNNDVKFLSECLNQLVQATKRNINEIKEKLESSIEMYDIANFTRAFIQAFDILKRFRSEGQGAVCNQAVMLVTDGASETYESVFREYNPNAEIRVFTYVIGREVTQIKEVNWMACFNRGYYAQVANMAEVREQVQQYIPVMSRPLVLNQSRMFQWTPVYSAPWEIQLTEWVWDERVKAIMTLWIQQQTRQAIKSQVETIDGEKIENGEETEVTSLFEDNSKMNEIKRKILYNMEMKMSKPLTDRKKKIPLMISVSTPVYDQRKYINVTKKFLYKNVYKDADPEPIRIANMLGVAGTDVPIKDIQKMASPFKLGVNCYSFMITNNGKILYHPDFRPLFQDMLKPFYSQVDLLEVEISNDTEQARQVHSDIEKIRSDMINGIRGRKRIMIKSMIDGMRPTLQARNYIYDKVNNTPYSFAIVLSEPHGLYRFDAQINLKKEFSTENYTRYFSDTLWRLHPDWAYLTSPYRVSGVVPSSPEDALIQFLNNELRKNRFDWRKNGIEPPKFQNYTCDKDLLQSLIFDAKTTHNFGRCHRSSRKYDAKVKIEVLNAFVSTRSGLTRFTNPYFSYDFKNRSESEYQSLTRSIDEIYYRRAVDMFHIDNKAFVYSVPFDEGNQTTKVTASFPIFVGKAPVAVVGVQYEYNSFRDTFYEIAENQGLDCSKSDCYVLDNNAFVLISEDKKQTGIYFGEIDDTLLQELVRLDIYRKVQLFDYQAICINSLETKGISSSSSSSLFHPLQHLRNMFSMLVSRLVALYLNLLYDSWTVAGELVDNMENEDNGDVDYKPEIPSEPRHQPRNHNKPKPCDKIFNLTELNYNFTKQMRHIQHMCSEDCSRNFYVQNIAHSNMLLLVLKQNECNCTVTTNKIEFKPVDYRKSSCQSFHSERKRPEFCVSHHPNETEIKYCGGSFHLYPAHVVYYALFGLIVASFRLF